MLNVSDLQGALITTLKAYTDLTTALGGSTEIREDAWPGTDWVYPCVRVAINLISPSTSGKCHLSAWSATFSIFVYTQPTDSGGVYDTSSDPCSSLMRHVAAAIFGKKVEPTGFVCETRVNVTGQNAPVSMPPPGGWRGEVLFETRLKEV